MNKVVNFCRNFLSLIGPKELEELPKGTKLVSIFGDIRVVGEDIIDDDTRNGMLAYGFYPGVAERPSRPAKVKEQFTAAPIPTFAEVPKEKIPDLQFFLAYKGISREEFRNTLTHKDNDSRLAEEFNAFCAGFKAGVSV